MGPWRAWQHTGLCGEVGWKPSAPCHFSQPGSSLQPMGPDLGPRPWAFPPAPPGPGDTCPLRAIVFDEVSSLSGCSCEDAAHGPLLPSWLGSGLIAPKAVMLWAEGLKAMMDTVKALRS